MMNLEFHRYYLVLLILGIMLSSSASRCQGKSPLKINFNSTAYVQIELTEVDTSFDLVWSYHPKLSKNRTSTPTYHISGDTTLIIPTKINMPQRVVLPVYQMAFPIFLTIDDTVNVAINLKTNKIDYAGKNRDINQYYASVYKRSEAGRSKYIELYNDIKRDWPEIYLEMDSIAFAQKDLLSSTKIDLPAWFTRLELQKQIIRNAYYKLSAPNYRNFLSKENTSIPDIKNYDFLKSLDLKAAENQYLSEYYIFMNFYAFYKVYGTHYVLSDSVTQLFNDPALSTKMFEVFENEVNEQNLIVFQVSNTYRDISKNTVRKTARLNYLKDRYGADNMFVKHLLSEESKMPDTRLKKGKKAPALYLDDGHGTYHSLEDQKGKVVLLNFYIRGCKPCYKAVPFEKALLKEYGKRGFSIMNICVTDNLERFEKAKEEFNMEGINVLTQGAWKKGVIQKYNIAGYPHYTLIDPEGKVIMNHAFKPGSEELNALIVEHLGN